MNGALRVLMVEDSATDAKLVIKELERTGQSVESERVETAERMRNALEHNAWDVVTSDWSMPEFTAAAALGVLKEMRLDVPFIIVSGTTGEHTAVEAMRAGAHDFVLKHKLARLSPAIERELRECNERKARRAAEVVAGLSAPPTASEPRTELRVAVRALLGLVAEQGRALAA